MAAIVGKTAAQFARALKNIISEANRELNQEGPPNPKVIQKLRKNYKETKVKLKEVAPVDSGLTKLPNKRTAKENEAIKKYREALEDEQKLTEDLTANQDKKPVMDRGDISSRSIGAGEGSHTKGTTPFRDDVLEDSKKVGEGTDTGKGEHSDKARELRIRGDKSVPFKTGRSKRDDKAIKAFKGKVKKVPEGKATFKNGSSSSKNQRAAKDAVEQARQQSVRIGKRKVGDNKFVSPAEINKLVKQANDLKTTIANTDVSQRINRVYKIKLDKITNKVKKIKESEPYYFPKSSKPPKNRKPTDKDFAHVEKTSRQLAKLRKEFAAIKKDFKEALDNKKKLVEKQAGMKNTVYGPRTTNKKNLAPGTYTDDKDRKKVRDRRRVRRGEKLIQKRKDNPVKIETGPTKLNAARKDYKAFMNNRNKIEEILSDPDFAQQDRKINQLQKLAGRYTTGQINEIMKGTGSPPQVGRKKAVPDEKTTYRSFADKDEYKNAPDSRGTPEQIALKFKRPKRSRSQIIKNAQNAPVAIQNLLVRQGIIKRSELKSSYVPKKTKAKPYKPKKPEVRKGKPRVVNGKTVETTQYRKKGGKVLKAKPKRKVTTIKRKTTAPRKRAALRGYGKALRGF